MNTQMFVDTARALNANTALFSHGQFDCVLAARWIGLPLVEAQHFTPGTASLGVTGHDRPIAKCRSSLCGMRLQEKTSTLRPTY